MQSGREERPEREMPVVILAASMETHLSQPHWAKSLRRQDGNEQVP